MVLCQIINKIWRVTYSQITMLKISKIVAIKDRSVQKKSKRFHNFKCGPKSETEKFIIKGVHSHIGHGDVETVCRWTHSLRCENMCWWDHVSAEVELRVRARWMNAGKKSTSKKFNFLLSLLPKIAVREFVLKKCSSTSNTHRALPHTLPLSISMSSLRNVCLHGYNNNKNHRFSLCTRIQPEYSL